MEQYYGIRKGDSSNTIKFLLEDTSQTVSALPQDMDVVDTVV